MQVRVVLDCHCVCRKCGALFLIKLTDYPDNLDIQIECPFCRLMTASIINAKNPEEPYYETEPDK